MTHSYIATLISQSENSDLTEFAEMLSREIDEAKICWLSKGTACEIPIPNSHDIDAINTLAKSQLSNQKIDFAILPIRGRRKNALIADMDSTMIDQECIDELAAEIGVKDQVAAITAKAMNGEIEFEPALRERVALLKGLSSTITKQVIANRITLAKGGSTLLATMKQYGAWTALVSGGFTIFTDEIATMLGFDENHANRLEVIDGKFTGKVIEPILGAEAKVTQLENIAKNKGLTPQEFIAVGDGANDLPMLKLAGTGVALHAKPNVARKADIKIEHCDLTALLYLQGYKESEFVNA